MSDDEWGRRAVIGTVGGFIGGFLFGGGYGFNQGKRQGRKEGRTNIDVYIYDNGEVYEGDPDDIGDDLEPNNDNVDSWDELIPDTCNLEQDERDWLESRLDEEYDNLDSDDFFDYVGGEVRVGQSGDEIRMTVDSDYNGGDYLVEEGNGYNIPNAC